MPVLALSTGCTIQNTSKSALSDIAYVLNGLKNDPSKEFIGEVILKINVV